MIEYIEKAEFIKKLCFETAEWYYSPTIKIINEFPAADVQPVKRGRWVAQLYGHVFCTFCGKEQKFSSDFCKHCGADMREPETTKG